MVVALPGISQVPYLYIVQMPVINCIVECKFLVLEYCFAQVFYLKCQTIC